jgi:hypothetical protein
MMHRVERLLTAWSVGEVFTMASASHIRQISIIYALLSIVSVGEGNSLNTNIDLFELVAFGLLQLVASAFAMAAGQNVERDRVG